MSRLVMEGSAEGKGREVGAEEVKTADANQANVGSTSAGPCQDKTPASQQSHEIPKNQALLGLRPGSTYCLTPGQPGPWPVPSACAVSRTSEPFLIPRADMQTQK